MRLALIPFLLLCAQPFVARAAVTVTPAADAFTSTLNPAGNFGGGGIMAVSASNNPTYGGFSGIMKFDLAAAKASLDASFPGGWTATSVVLTMTSTSGVNTIFNPTSEAGSFTATWVSNDTWTEGAGTPMAPGASGINNNSLDALLSGSTTELLGTYAYDGGTSGTRDITLGLTAGLLADLLGGSTTSVAFAPGDTTINMFFNSRSFMMSAAARPFLTINAVGTAPEPGRAGLLAVSVLGLIWCRRRPRSES